MVALRRIVWMWTALAVLAMGAPGVNADIVVYIGEERPAESSTDAPDEGAADENETDQPSAGQGGSRLDPFGPDPLLVLPESCDSDEENCFCQFGVRSEDSGSLDLDPADGEMSVPGAGESQLTGWTIICANF